MRAGVKHDDEEVLSLCSLFAGGRLFGIDTRTIREVLGKGRLNRVPLAPGFIGGVIAYRGEVVTAVNLRALLGAAPVEASQSCILVLDGDGFEERFGLMVDSVGGVVMVNPRTVSPNPPTLDEDSRMLFLGSYRTDAGLLVQLDSAQLDPERLKSMRLAETGLPSHGSRSRPAADATGLERVSKG
jgi:purine-binding chemotaxis protein CheW